MDTSLLFPEWLDYRIKKTIQNTSFNTSPFLKLDLMTLSRLRSDYMIATKLKQTLTAFPLILTVTCSQNVYDKSRLFEYDSHPDYQRIPECNIGARLIFKLKTISFAGVFDSILEQELGLAMGIIRGVSQIQGYQLSTVPENLYGGLTDRSTTYPKRQCVHLMGITAKTKNSNLNR